MSERRTNWSFNQSRSSRGSAKRSTRPGQAGSEIGSLSFGHSRWPGEASGIEVTLVGSPLTGFYTIRERGRSMSRLGTYVAAIALVSLLFAIESVVQLARCPVSGAMRENVPGHRPGGTRRTLSPTP